MRIIRLPGIHHDANAVIFSGKEEKILVDAGTTWYQMLQVERISGHLAEEEQKTLSRILLTSRRFPFSGGAKYISENWDHIHASLSEREANDLVNMIDRAADRMEQFKRDLLNQMEKEMDNEWD